MSKVALIFVFNHRYDKNIEVLEKIYNERFSHMYHLVPFYNGSKSNVIPVYESSFYFQGYLAQGLKTYFDETYDHYFFVADDLILNPSINENNYATHFKLSAGTSYLPEIFNLHHLTNNDTLRFEEFYNIKGNPKYYWWRIKNAIGYQHEKEGVEVKSELPAYKESEELLRQHGYAAKPVSYTDVFGRFFPFSLSGKIKRDRITGHLRYFKRGNKKYQLSYPLVCSYSDIVIVSKSTIKKFCSYCGAFAANELFVEFAIPTALLLSSNDVITEPKIGARGEIYWSYSKEEAQNFEKAMEPYQYNLQNLLQNFPKNSLYIHPIKLSKWKTETV